MTRIENDNIVKVLELTKQMLALADQGDRDRVDTGCGILFGKLRDTAYQLRQLAEAERKTHQLNGKWNR